MRKLFATALVLLQCTACAYFSQHAQKEAETQNQEQALQGYQVRLVNETDSAIEYRFNEFELRAQRSYSERELNPNPNSMSFNFSFRDLAPGDSVTLRVLPNSTLALKYKQGEKSRNQDITVKKNQEITLSNEGVRQKDWTPPF